VRHRTAAPIKGSSPGGGEFREAVFRFRQRNRFEKPDLQETSTMMSFAMHRCMLLVAGAATIAGCAGGLQAPISRAAASAAGSGAKSKTFDYTGKRQSFRVPSGITKLTVAAYGAGGPTGKHDKGGNGAFVQATIPVKPGEKLTIVVGGEGGKADVGTDGTGGFNGGANGGATGNHYDFGGDGGGGASDVREGGSALANRILVAGGGAGGGVAQTYYGAGHGGAGGADIGQRGGGRSRRSAIGGGGKGGTQTAGGNGGHPGSRGYSYGGNGDAGSLGIGGQGGGSSDHPDGGGGGGGGGCYGGGGGSGSIEPSGTGGGGGGGGGSSYIESSASGVTNKQGGAPAGNGLIVNSW
jgi:hypothetical protein